MNSQETAVPTFSRLQLAAALIEYDNDPDDPNPPHRAQDSALFARLRTSNPARARKLTGYDHLRQTPDHLGVQLPVNDGASAKLAPPPPQHPSAGTRSSKGSVDLLRNPFGADAESEAGIEEGQESEEEPEVDLEAWGMSGLLENKKESSRSRQQRERRLSKAHSEMLPNPYSHNGTSGPKSPFQQHSKAKSLGGLGDNLEPFGGPLIASEADFRRRTISVPLDPAGRVTPDFQRPLSQGSQRLLPNRPALQHHPLSPSPNHIPFPIATTPEPEPGEEESNVFQLPLTAPISRFDPKSSRPRTTSRGSRHSLGSQSKLALEQDEDIFTANSDRASRFDVDFNLNQLRPLSLASFGGTINTRQADFAGETDRGPSPERMLSADIRIAHTRTVSNASLGSRLPLENELEIGEERGDRATSRRFSRLDLLRPKVLIMPSPLQNSEEQNVSQSAGLPAGFQLATLGPPLPPGAQTGSPSTLTPNPRLSMTLSQLTFRNSLLTDGQRDVTFVDIERNLRRAERDGEQIIQEEDIEEEIAQEQRQAHGRPAGKLYGRSLMDELQARKEKLKSKTRVFTGDQRPPMMTRSELRRSTTLIDPATLRDPLPSQVQSKSQDETVDLQRRPSKSKPLLSFDDKPGPSGAVKTNATFGHDKLWEQELQRRKQIDAAVKAEEEEEQRREAARAAKKKAKKKQKEEIQPPKVEPAKPPRRMSVVPDLPPTLPSIPTTTARRAPPPTQDESESDSDSEASLRAAKLKSARMAERARSSQDWLSSDDEAMRPKKAASPPVLRLPSGSDEDLPLSALARGSIRPIQQLQPGRGSDSEDERPLSTVLQKKLAVSSFGFGDFNLDATLSTKKAEEETDDNVPLAVRHPQARAVSAMFPQTNEDDDDKPLGLKQIESQQQMQQVQYHNLLAAQQHMMMMQPSMTMPFAAGPPVMNGFPPYMMAPQQIFAPQPIRPDSNSKLQSVDRWRHSVQN